ncbi:MAG: DUF1501 domain-containing protein [Pirellulaceae bacterium]
MNSPADFTRRDFLSRGGGGFGMLALASLLKDEGGLMASDASQIRTLHHPPKAKSVIWLFMNGGPSGIDLFDPKPALEKWDGKRFPGKIQTLFPHPGPIMRSPFEFQRHGESGASVSNVFPHVAEHVDDITFLLACGSEAQNHVPACYMVNSGVKRVGFPGIGSWVTYGLGNGNRDLPGYIVMYDHRSAPEGGANLWDAAFLPGATQGVPFRSSDKPILYLNRPQNAGKHTQQSQLELLRKLNGWHWKQHTGDLELQTRIQSLETAYRMQSAAPKIVSISDESAATKRMYGLDVPECKHFGTQLLMARRLVEKGVRFVQIYHGGWDNNWDSHSSLEKQHGKLCMETDQPIAALLSDLKQRGMFDETLVLWGGEFGRTPTSQDRDGRDHNPYGFTMWLAGGGVKRGFRFGETDELGYKPIENPVSMHDLHATILHLLGLDHEQLTFHFNGRDQTLVNELGSVVHDILA